MYNDELIHKLVHIEGTIYQYQITGDFDPVEAMCLDIAYSGIALKRFCFASTIQEFVDYLRDHPHSLECDSMMYPYEYYIWVGCKGNNTMRAIPDYQIFYVYSGHVDVIFPEHTERISAGDVLLLDRDVMVRIVAEGEENVVITTILTTNYVQEFLAGTTFEALIPPMFRLKNEPQADESPCYQIIHQNGNERLRFLFSALVREYTDKLPLSDKAMMNYLNLVLVEIYRTAEKNDPNCHQPMNANRLGDVICYINDHFDEVTLEGVAAQVHFSPNYLSGALKKATGMTFKELVHKARLSKTVDMLKESDMPITTISSAVGYRNITYFYEIFRRYYGMSPAEYRNKYKNET